MKTLRQAERITGVKAGTLRQMLNRKTIKGRKIGRLWLISDETIEELTKEVKQDD